MTKTYHVSLMVEVLACIEVDDSYPKGTIGTMALEAVSIFSGQGNVSLELENIKAIDIVEIIQEANDAR